MPQRLSLSRLLGLLLSVTALLAGLVACGSPATTTGSPPVTTYRYETSAPVNLLDPVAAYSTGPESVIENLYQGLYGYTKTGGASPQPELATGYSVSSNGLTYTFDLRQGVVFHSGNPFTCADVAYSIERALVTNPPNSGVWSLAIPLTGTAQNANADSSVDWSLIDGAVTCTNPHQVVFHLKQVSPAFLAIIAETPYAIVDSVWAKAHGEWDGTQATWRSWVGADLSQDYMSNHASGTGAYRLASASSSGVTATAFKQYWGTAPSFDQVEETTVTDATTRIADLLAGTADRIDLDRSRLPQVTGKTGVTVHSDPSWTSLTVDAILFTEALDATNNPYLGSGALDGNGIPSNFFADRDTRLCFAYSFDPHGYITSTLGGHGTQLTMDLPPSLLGYNSAITPYSADATKATTYCKAAQGGTLWSTGFALSAVYNNGNTTRQAALENLKAHLEALNAKFHVTIVGVPWATYLQDIQARKLPVFDMGWLADYPDPDNFIRTFYDSTGYYGTPTGFADATIDSEIQQAATSLDTATRARLYQDIGSRAHDLAPLIPLPQGTPSIVARTQLKGVYDNPVLSGGFLWKDVSN